MDTEPVTSNKKKFLIIGLVAALALVVVSYLVLSYPQRGSVETPPPPGLKEPTEAEKLLRSQVEELDRLRAQQKQGTSQRLSTTTIQSQVKSLDLLRKQAAKQKTTSTTAKQTIAEQMQELDALRAVANK